MLETPPQQLFDGSFTAAILEMPQLGVAPPNVTLEPIEGKEELEDLGEIETFDWDSYNRNFFERIPESAKRTEEGQRMARIAGTQLWMARRLPPEVVGYLMGVTSTKLLWSYLNAPDRKELLKQVTRGFQRTPQIVRQPAVRARWLEWLEGHPEEIYVLLVMWSFSTPQPPIIAYIEAQPDDDKLKRKLPAIFHKYGIEATFCALSFTARPHAFRATVELFNDRNELERVMENADESLLEPEAPVKPVTEETDSSDQLWKAKFEEANSARSRMAEALEQMRDNADRLARNLARQEKELQLLHKRESVANAQWEKKLESVRERAETEVEELNKTLERTNRKLRALERDFTELELENRRLQKQLRHTGSLLEEERRKMAKPVVPEPKPEPVKPKGAPKPPLPRGPLDEIFEWKADGRPVKVTPRALKNLIDRNDEEAVFAVMQALESLKQTDKPKHIRFLTRLGEAGTYYPRVLTQRTTRVLVDASNVARHVPNRRGKGQLSFLTQIREELRRFDCFPILFYADASLRHNIDDAARFNELIENGEIIPVDKGVEADEILAREARRTGAYVVTNDAKFFHKVSPDFEPPRVSFRILDGTVIVDEF